MSKETITDLFCRQNFLLKGKLGGITWRKHKLLPVSGESANIFELKKLDQLNNIAECKTFIGKLFSFGLTKKSLSIYLRLKNENYTEVFYDYSIVDLENSRKLYFGVFSKIDYSARHIPNFFPIEKAEILLFEALNHIHSLKILHNDLKPDNIMTSFNNIKLIDFEFALDINSNVYSSSCLIEYTHPKTLKDEKYFDVNIDKWAAICSLYEIYYNLDLFPAKNIEKGGKKMSNSDKYLNIVEILNKTEFLNANEKLFLEKLKTFF